MAAPFFVSCLVVSWNVGRKSVFANISSTFNITAGLIRKSPETNQ